MNTNSADVVIVGSGIAGAIMAAELSKKGIKVTILEAGSMPNRAQAMEKYFNSVIKIPESPYDQAPHAPFPLTVGDTYFIQKGKEPFKSTYLRVAGGTTWHWLGTAIRFLPEDFKMKTNFGVGKDWPIQYSDLEAWYTLAEKEIGVSGDNNEDLGSPRSQKYPMPKIPHTLVDQYLIDKLKGSPFKINHTPQARNSVANDSRPPCCGNASCIPCCPIQAKYDATVHLNKAISNGAKFIPNAVAFHINTSEDGKISEIQFKRPDKKIESIKGKLFILAMNAIETSKLLLMSKSEKYQNGIANYSDQVGRNLSDHPEVLVYGLTRNPVYPYRSPGSTGGIDSTRSGNFRKKYAAARLEITSDGWTFPEGDFQPLIKSLTEKGFYGAELENKFNDIVSRQITMASLTEMLPNPNNKIIPSKDKFDAIGIPKPEIYFSLDDYTKNGFKVSIENMKHILSMAQCTDIKISKSWYGAGHVMGTYLMGNDPKNSVVDSNLKSHDHSNLYLLGSGVMPTTAAANPTLTIAALSLRCSKHIVEKHFFEKKI